MQPVRCDRLECGAGLTEGQGEVDFSPLCCTLTSCTEAGVEGGVIAGYRKHLGVGVGEQQLF